MTTQANLSTKFFDSLLGLLASAGYKPIDKRTFICDIDGDIYGMLTVAIDTDRDSRGLYFMLFAGVGAKRVRQTLAMAYEQTPKYNIPLIARPLSSFNDFEQLSETFVCNEEGACQLAALYAEAFKKEGVRFIESHASYADLLEALRDGDSGAWEDRAERRLAILELTAPRDLATEYANILVEGRRMKKHLERVSGFYERLGAEK